MSDGGRGGDANAPFSVGGRGGDGAPIRFGAAAGGAAAGDPIRIDSSGHNHRGPTTCSPGCPSYDPHPWLDREPWWHLRDVEGLVLVLVIWLFTGAVALAKANAYTISLFAGATVGAVAFLLALTYLAQPYEGHHGRSRWSGPRD